MVITKAKSDSGKFEALGELKRQLADAKKLEGVEDIGSRVQLLAVE